MANIYSNSNSLSSTKHQYNFAKINYDAIRNYVAFGLIAFGLLFIEQKVLKFFIFPINFSITFFGLRWYSLLIYFIIFIELIRRVRYKIKLGDSFKYLSLLYIIQFLSYVINTPGTSFYALFTNYIFGYSIEIVICILCYLYVSDNFVKLLPPLIFIICIINLFFMLSPSEKLSVYRILAIGSRGNEVNSTTVGLYTYPNEAGMLGVVTVALAFSLESPILIAIITIIGLIVAILTIERAPFIGLIFTVFPLRIYFKYQIKKALVLVYLLTFFGIIFFAYHNLPSYFFNAQNKIISRFELGSFVSNNQNTLLGGLNARNDVYSSGLNLTLKSPIFGNGNLGVDEYMQESGQIGLGHNFFIESSATNGIIYAIILIIAYIRAFKGFWRIRRVKWGATYLAAYLSFFPSLLFQSISPWLFWILLAIGLIIYDQKN